MLISYRRIYKLFLNKFPQNIDLLKEKNKDVKTDGNISQTLYRLIKELYNNEKYEEEYYKIINSSYNKRIKPYEILKIIGKYNEYLYHGPYHWDLKDPKEYYVFILESIHNELNYLGDKNIVSKVENQYSRGTCFNNYVVEHYKNNSSIVSKLFSGIFEKIIRCKNCQKKIYSYQSFYLLELNMEDYNKKDFNIYNAFEEQKFKLLINDNEISCNICKNLNTLEYCGKIIIPPNILVIGLDYGRNYRYFPKSVIFDEIIDISKYVNYNYANSIIYRLFGICSFVGNKNCGDMHFISFCKNLNTNEWFRFNDAVVTKDNIKERKRLNPYILFYERIK